MDKEAACQKIRKLLALGNSPYESEAKAAILKARKLMAEYKLEEADFADKDEPVTHFETAYTYTSMTNGWLVILAQVIAPRYCCVVTCLSRYRAKKHTIQLSGVGTDLQICKIVLDYAVDCVFSILNEMKKEFQAQNLSASMIRYNCNAYGIGFAEGLKAQYEEQDKEHQEWGLVLVLPEQVQEYYDSLAKSHHTPVNSGCKKSRQYRQQGFQDGYAFHPEQRIGE